MDVLFISAFFLALFPQHIFPIHLYRVAYKWQMVNITYQQVNDNWNIHLISIVMWYYHIYV